MSVAEDDPEVVYHYTSMETMMKIVESETIRATSIRYLNDVSERDMFMNFIRRRIPQSQSLASVEEAVFEAVNQLNPGTDCRFIEQPCVASFSADDDSLPQWRSYCPNGNGVSIGFRTDCLKRAEVPSKLKEGAPIGVRLFNEPPTIRYQKVTYIDELQTEYIDDIIKESAVKCIEYEIVDLKNGSEISLTAADYFLYDIQERACFIKHSSFSNEKEYRLLTRPLYSAFQYLEYRATRSTLAPYISVKIPRYDSRNTNPTPPATLLTTPQMDFVARIVVGPTPNKQLSLDAVHAYFKTMKLNVEVVPSKVPFRDL